MARTRLQKCTTCGAYGLSEICKECGAPAQAAVPMRFSPEDARADLLGQRRECSAWTDGSKELKDVPATHLYLLNIIYKTKLFSLIF